MSEEKKTPNDFEGYALLVGNGLGLSHPGPAMSRLFKFDQVGVKKVLKKDVLQNFLYEGFNDPEEMMQYMRIELAIAILKSYINNTDVSLGGLNNFLNLFKSIYNLNYDLITYKAAFDIDKNKSLKFNDGFLHNPIDMPPDRIELNLAKICSNFDESNRSLYYLHGFFPFFFTKKKDEYVKLKAYSDTSYNGFEQSYISLTQNCMTYYDRVLTYYRKNRDYEYNPIIVLESKSRYKEAIINDIPLLKFYMNKFKQEKKVLTFGCSFKNDDHLIEALFSGKAEEIYFGYYSPEDKKNIEKAIERVREKVSNESSQYNSKEGRYKLIPVSDWNIWDRSHQTPA